MPVRLETRDLSSGPVLVKCALSMTSACVKTRTLCLVRQARNRRRCRVRWASPSGDKENGQLTKLGSGEMGMLEKKVIVLFCIGGGVFFGKHVTLGVMAEEVLNRKK